ncbi:hypothetical protein MTQ13_18510, partial [Streptomyces sp. XM4011]|uniref:hypothetical protein n=1 Tax=Streptomyces sp. XM4011 TaxID=2929780 RepID=UPI001FF76A61
LRVVRGAQQRGGPGEVAALHIAYGELLVGGGGRGPAVPAGRVRWEGYAPGAVAERLTAVVRRRARR